MVSISVAPPLHTMQVGPCQAVSRRREASRSKKVAWPPRLQSLSIDALILIRPGSFSFESRSKSDPSDKKPPKPFPLKAQAQALAQSSNRRRSSQWVAQVLFFLVYSIVPSKKSQFDSSLQFSRTISVTITFILHQK